MKTRLGDLSGLSSGRLHGTDPATAGFGLYSQNVFLEGGIVANTGSIAGVKMESSKMFTGTGTWGNTNTGFYLDNEASMSLGDKFKWDGNELTIVGNITLTGGAGVATPASVSGSFGTQTAISGSVTDLSSSAASALTTVSGSAAASLTSVSGSVATSIAAVTSSITSEAATAAANLSSVSSSTAANIMTNAEGKIIQTPTVTGTGLFLTATHMGYATNGSWNTYMGNDGQFLLKIDNDNLISYSSASGSSLIVKTNEAVISGSSVSLVTPKFFFGSDAQYVSGSNGNIEISSSNFHLQADGDVTMSGEIKATSGVIGGWTITENQLESNNIKINATSGYIEAGGLTNVSDIGDASVGFFANKDGEILLKAGTSANKNYMQFKDGTLDINTDKAHISGSEITLETPKFFLGKKGSQFLSGSNNNIEISSSAYHLSASTFKLGDKLSWDGTNLEIEGNITLTGGSGVATPESVSGSFGTQTAISGSADAAQTAAQNYAQGVGVGAQASASVYSDNAALSASVYSANAVSSASVYSDNAALSASIYSAAAVASASLYASASAVSASGFANTVQTNLNSVSQSTAANIMTNAEGKIIQTPTVTGTGLFLTSTHMGYATAGSWNTYMANDGQFLFKIDNDNLISYSSATGSALIIKTNEAVISGSSVSLLTPKFFFGDDSPGKQYISGSSGNLVISSSNFQTSASRFFVGDRTGSRIEFDNGELFISSSKFFAGNTGSAFISASNGQMELSSSKFQITPKGDAIFKGDLTGASGTFSGTVTINAALAAQISGSSTEASASLAQASASMASQIVLSSAGMALKNQSGTTLADYGTSITLGVSNQAKQTISSTNTTFYDGDGSTERLKITNDGTIDLKDSSGVSRVSITADPKVIIGKSDDNRIEITDSAFSLYEGSTEKISIGSSDVKVKYDADNYTQMDSNSFDVIVQKATSASFGATTTIGPTSANHVSIDGSSISIKNASTTHLSASSAGLYTSGHIHSAHGTIGGWNITSDKLYSGTDADFVGLIAGTGIQIGDSTFGDAEFTVNTAGAVTASNINLTGNITANYITANTGGSIGGWDINNGYLEKDGTRLNAGGNNGYLGIGITTYDAADGIWIGEVSDGVYKFSIKSADGSKYLRYTDSAFEIAAGNFSLNASGNVTASNINLTGNITANYITANTAGQVGGWNVTSDAIYTGTKTTTGYTSNGEITLNSNGEIHTPTFYVESDGSSAFKGTLTIQSALAAQISGSQGELSSSAATGIAGLTQGSSSMATQVVLDSGGMTLKNAAGNSTLASYGTTTTIGDTSGEHISIDSSAFEVKTSATNTVLSASAAGMEMSGSIYAGGGKIGGWTISQDKLSSGTDADFVGLIAGTGIQIGDSTFGDAEFTVNTAGAVTASNIRLSGDITANYITAIAGGNLAGWTTTDSYIYGLTSGTPTDDPSDGLVLKSGANAVITTYENTQKRVELGYLSSGIYGIKGYADNGTTATFEMSDTQQMIAGWEFNDEEIKKVSATGGIALKVVSSQGKLIAYRDNETTAAVQAGVGTLSTPDAEVESLTPDQDWGWNIENPDDAGGSRSYTNANHGTSNETDTYYTAVQGFGQNLTRVAANPTSNSQFALYDTIKGSYIPTSFSFWQPWKNSDGNYDTTDIQPRIGDRVLGLLGTNYRFSWKTHNSSTTACTFNFPVYYAGGGSVLNRGTAKVPTADYSGKLIKISFWFYIPNETSDYGYQNLNSGISLDNVYSTLKYELKLAGTGDNTTKNIMTFADGTDKDPLGVLTQNVLDQKGGQWIKVTHTVDAYDGSASPVAYFNLLFSHPIQHHSDPSSYLTNTQMTIHVPKIYIDDFQMKVVDKPSTQIYDSGFLAYQSDAESIRFDEDGLDLKSTLGTVDVGDLRTATLNMSNERGENPTIKPSSTYRSGSALVIQGQRGFTVTSSLEAAPGEPGGDVVFRTFKGGEGSGSSVTGDHPGGNAGNFWFFTGEKSSGNNSNAASGSFGKMIIGLESGSLQHSASFYSHSYSRGVTTAGIWDETHPVNILPDSPVIVRHYSSSIALQYATSESFSQQASTKQVLGSIKYVDGTGQTRNEVKVMPAQSGSEIYYPVFVSQSLLIGGDVGDPNPTSGKEIGKLAFGSWTAGDGSADELSPEGASIVAWVSGSNDWSTLRKQTSLDFRLGTIDVDGAPYNAEPSTTMRIIGNGVSSGGVGGPGSIQFLGRITGDILPQTSNYNDLGSTSYRWQNLYTTDLQLSNLGREEGNKVDGTKGDWTLQEGEEDLFVINNVSGKKYKIALIPTEEP